MQNGDNILINYTTSTGDPFADVGSFAIKDFARRFPGKDILDLIMEVTKIYVNDWGGKLNTFFLNSKITQPAFNKEKKIEETKKYFQSLLDESEPFENGYCRITGRKTKLFLAGRDNSMLTGSGTFVNFHHGFERGIMLSKEALIRFHFVPIGSQLLQGKIAIIHSNDNVLTEFFVRENVSGNFDNLHTDDKGILKSGCRAPSTALFRFAEKAIVSGEIESQRTHSLTLYHFTNFGASPEIQIYRLPSVLFAFYAFTQRMENKAQWNKFVAPYYSNYDYKNAKFNPVSKNMEYTKKGEMQLVGDSEYKNWRNKIYDKLLREESIVRDMRRQSELEPLNFKIVEVYLQEIRDMKKETIEKINQMADFILDANDNSGVEKAIKKLNGVKNGYLLRRFIIKDIVAKYYEKEKENEETIVTVEEYAEYLFPDTGTWSEMRDVLLIAIYQRLHARNLKLENLRLDDNDDDGDYSE